MISTLSNTQIGKPVQVANLMSKLKLDLKEENLDSAGERREVAR